MSSDDGQYRLHSLFEFAVNSAKCFNRKLNFPILVIEKPKSFLNFPKWWKPKRFEFSPINTQNFGALASRLKILFSLPSRDSGLLHGPNVEELAWPPPPYIGLILATPVCFVTFLKREKIELENRLWSGEAVERGNTQYTFDWYLLLIVYCYFYQKKKPVRKGDHRNAKTYFTLSYHANHVGAASDWK